MGYPQSVGTDRPPRLQGRSLGLLRVRIPTRPPGAHGTGSRQPIRSPLRIPVAHFPVWHAGLAGNLETY